MNLKYSKILENKTGKSATFFLFGTIGQDVNGDIFANELRFVAETQQIKNITILINSVGGNVFQGYSIIAAVDYLQQNNTNIILKNVGIAYSMAGVLLASGKKGNRKAFNYSTVMIHDARFSDKNENISESEKELISKVGESLAILISKNSNKDIEMIKTLMSKETTFSANEAKTAGLIDEVEETGKKIDQDLNNELKMVACADLLNSSINIKSNKMKIVNAFLGLNEEANEQAILSAVKEIKQESTVKDGMIEDLEKKAVLADAKINALTGENKNIKEAALKVNAETLINESVKGGKITKEGTEKWIENAVKDYEGTKALLESLNGTPANINDKLKDSGTPNDKTNGEKYLKLLNETPDLLDSMDEKELKVLEDAYYKMAGDIDVTVINN